MKEKIIEEDHDKHELKYRGLDTGTVTFLQKYILW